MARRGTNQNANRSVLPADIDGDTRRGRDIIATKTLAGPFGKIEEGEIIPNTIPPDTVRSWLKCEAAGLRDSEGNVGHWNEDEDGDPLADLPDNPLPIE